MGWQRMILAPAVSQYHTSSTVVCCGSNKHGRSCDFWTHLGKVGESLSYQILLFSLVLEVFIKVIIVLALFLEEDIVLLLSTLLCANSCDILTWTTETIHGILIEGDAMYLKALYAIKRFPWTTLSSTITPAMDEQSNHNQAIELCQQPDTANRIKLNRPMRHNRPMSKSTFMYMWHWSRLWLYILCLYVYHVNTLIIVRHKCIKMVQIALIIIFLLIELLSLLLLIQWVQLSPMGKHWFPFVHRG